MRGRVLRHKSTIQRVTDKQRDETQRRMSKYVKPSVSLNSSSDDLKRLEETSVRIADWLSKQHQAYYRSTNRGDIGKTTCTSACQIARLLSPHGSFIQSWKKTSSAMIICSIWFVLFNWAFQPPMQMYPHYQLLEILVELFFVVDVCLHFRITYPNDSTLQLATNSKDVATHYLTDGFLGDFIGTFPVFVAVIIVTANSTATPTKDVAKSVQFWNVIKLFRLARLARIWKADKMKLDYMQLVNLLIYFASLAHFVSCVWFGFCGHYHLENYPNYNLIGREFGVIQTSSISEKYTYSMYYGLLLVLGENIPPRSVFEAWFAWFSLFLGCIAFSAVVGQVTVLMQELHHERNLYYERLLALEAKMRILKIPKELSRRVLEWEAYTWDRFHAQDANALFADENPAIPIPRSLRTELALHAHAPMLLTCPLFYGAEEGFIAEVAMLLRLRISSAGDLIIQKDERDESMMFLKAGEAFILNPSKETEIIVHLKAGAFFGELSVCFGGKRSASIRAATYCELVVLSKQNLEDAWCVYPKAKEHILDTAHRRKKIITQMNKDNQKAPPPPEETAAPTKESATKGETVVGEGGGREAVVEMVPGSNTGTKVGL